MRGAFSYCAWLRPMLPLPIWLACFPAKDCLPSQRLSGVVETPSLHGSPEQGRMNSDTMKDLMPEQQRTGRIVAAVKAVSEQTGHGMAQVALAWLRYRPVPVIPILGARKLSQLQDNLASFNLAFPLLAPAQIESPRASPALSSVLV